jgi:hypothetical protein
MTTTLSGEIAAQVVGLITGTNGVNSVLSTLTSTGGMPLSPINALQVRAQNVAIDIADQANVMHYPSINVYCEKISNNLVEKYRTFSGSVQLVIEVRHSQDRLDGLQDKLDNYADAVMQVLNANRGGWGEGMFYGGAYQVAFGATKHGGTNFMQVAKITFEIGVSRS